MNGGLNNGIFLNQIKKYGGLMLCISTSKWTLCRLFAGQKFSMLRNLFTSITRKKGVGGKYNKKKYFPQEPTSI